MPWIFRALLTQNQNRWFHQLTTRPVSWTAQPFGIPAVLTGEEISCLNSRFRGLNLEHVEPDGQFDRQFDQQARLTYSRRGSQ